MSALTVINPATGNVLRELPADDAASVTRKAAMARRAQPGWAQRPLAERIGILRRFRDLLVERRDHLSCTMTAETGKPITMSRKEIGATPGRVDFFLENVGALMGIDTRDLQPAGALVPGAGEMEELVTQAPLGVVANISARNYPYFVGSNVFVPALLTGSAVLYKPSEFASLTGMAIAGLLHEAGVPDDVFIPLIGAGDVGAALLEQRVDGVFFTGSYRTGVGVAQTTAAKLIPTQLQLGGKDPAYVADDVDAATAGAALADGAFYNNGQSRCAVERIYVHESIFDAFVEAFIAAVEGFQMGDPNSESTYLGPLTREAQLGALEAQVQDALTKGATLRTGGRRADRAGWYFEPTVLTEVDHRMKVMRDETFGPLIGVQRVSNDQEAIDLMADTQYGLTAAVFSRDRKRAAHVLAAVPTGTAYWNCCDRVSPRLPWSGVGHSGLGAALGVEGIRAFLRPRAWHLRSL